MNDIEENPMNNVDNQINEENSESTSQQEIVESDDYYLPEDEYGNTIYTSEWLKKYTSVSGWLGFFLFAVGLGGIISAIMNVATINSEEYAGNLFLILTDVIPGISLLGIAIYTIYAFNQRKPNAVFWGKFYVILVFVTNLLALLFGEFDKTGLNTQPRAVQGFLYSIIWFIYLCVSKQVQEVIPPSFRKVTRKDWIISAIIMFLPILCFIIGLAQITSTVNQREANETKLLQTEISEHERTDGKIIFTIPYSFTCTDEVVTADNGVSIKVFSIDNEEIGSGTICSDYDNDISQRNFESYRESWKDPNTDNYSENYEDSGEKEINGNKCYYKIVSYNINGIKVFWRYYLIFNKTSEKVAVVSLYDKNEDISYVDELINSIRFN